MNKLDNDIVRLKDILRAIADIEAFAGRSSMDDRMAVMAIAYEIAIIGEAANNLSADVRATHTHIPWSDIIGMRHRIIHHYGKVNVDRLKEVVVTHLPVLKRQIMRILQGLEH